jgi:hypothetical protein
MPPFYFKTRAEEAERVAAASPEGAARIYEAHEAQDWMRGAMDDDTGDRTLAPIHRASLDFLANEVVEAVLAGDALMRIDVESREALQELAVQTAVDIQPLN